MNKNILIFYSYSYIFIILFKYLFIVKCLYRNSSKHRNHSRWPDKFWVLGLGTSTNTNDLATSFGFWSLIFFALMQWMFRANVRKLEGFRQRYRSKLQFLILTQTSSKRKWLLEASTNNLFNWQCYNNQNINQNKLTLWLWTLTNIKKQQSVPSNFV